MFSGIGGFEYGIEQSKYGEHFECIGYSEIDEYAESIYKRNFPKHINFGDATKIKTEELPDFEFLVGGFPCQAFSIAGKGRGFDDTRGTLFFEIARVLKDKRPRYFLLENVKGLLSHNKGETFKTILEVLSNLGYNVKWEIYNSKDYQVPQNRERIFIKGYFRAECGGEILLVGKNKKESSTIVNGRHVLNRSAYFHNSTDTITPTLTAMGQMSSGRRFIGKDARKIKKVGNYSPSNHHGKNIYSVDGLSPTLCAGSIMKNGLNILESVENNYELDKCVGSPRPHASKTKGDISPCLTANNYGSSSPIVQFKHKTETDNYLVRRLTPLECERLQGFPDNWTQLGVDGKKISDTQRYKCIGNAVTTTVITAIINEVFDDEKFKE